MGGRSATKGEIKEIKRLLKENVSTYELSYRFQRSNSFIRKVEKGYYDWMLKENHDVSNDTDEKHRFYDRNYWLHFNSIQELYTVKELLHRLTKYELGLIKPVDGRSDSDAEGKANRQTDEI